MAKKSSAKSKVKTTPKNKKVSARGAKPKAARRHKKGDTGKRYSPEERQEIVDYVASQGRGGISKACKKFKVSYIALRRWLQGAGVQAGNSSLGNSGKANQKLIAGLQKAAAETKSLRKQLTELHRLLRSLG